MRSFALTIVFMLAFATAHGASQGVGSQGVPTSASVSGKVVLPDGKPAEGVAVSASKLDSTIITSVFSDAKGRYAFPSMRLSTGTYQITIRATGYQLKSAVSVTIDGTEPADLDLPLVKVEHVEPQLSNAEWILSAPGTPDQKSSISLCVMCHSYERIMMSKYNAEDFQNIIMRMVGYAPGSIPIRPQVRPNQTFDHPERFATIASYLSSINLSSGPERKYPLKILPRAHGRATHVVVTEYKLPRPDMQPHDVALDKDGFPWYGDFGQQYIARLDPRTGQLREYPVPTPKPGSVKGVLDLEFDKNNNLWVALAMQAAVARFDLRTESFQVWAAPADQLADETLQISMIAPKNVAVDGQVWMDVVSTRVFHGAQRLNIATGKFEPFDIFGDSSAHYGTSGVGEGDGPPPFGRDIWALNKPASNLYDIATDSHNNPYFTDFADVAESRIGRVDAKSGNIQWFYTPTQYARPRRVTMNSRDQLWIAEFRGNKLARFDTTTYQFQEWQLPPGTFPYDVMEDKNGEVWTAGEHSDRIVRLNPRTGEIVEYPLPSSTDIRRIYIDNSTSPVTIWVGNNHGASIVKIEPLD
jgi:virginiamycin B lyase